VNVKIKVVQDTDAQSPREWDNLGVMACWHRRYNLGDVQPKESPEEWLAANAPKGSIVLPLYLYDHSGISMSTGDFGDRWDSGRVGYIVATPEAIRKNFMKKRITAKMRATAEEVLKQEVSTYDDYLRGNVWGYTIEATHPCGECGSQVHELEHEDSCWGFIGSDASTLAAMKEHVDDKHHAALEAAWHNRG
jgi:hypothetical protein